MKTFKQFNEGLGKLAVKTGLAITGGIVAKKGLDRAKQNFDNFIDNQRDQGIGGNTRPGSDKIYYGDKKKKQP
tara:strand:+ start:28 stop:246 length:219 start_codon:yes stop_codon:yes gene_type:complete